MGLCWLITMYLLLWCTLWASMMTGEVRIEFIKLIEVVYISKGPVEVDMNSNE